MAALNLLLVLWAALLFRSGFASHPEFTVAIRTHNAPGSSDAETHLALRQSLASMRKREHQADPFKQDISQKKSWENAVLLFLANEPGDDDDDDDSDIPPEPEVEIICTKCYINSVATAELKFENDVNISKVLDTTLNEVRDDLNGIWDDTMDWARRAGGKVWDDISDLNLDNITTIPPFNVSLDVDIESIPDASLHFNFEELELFLQVRTKLAAGSIYTIPILQPESKLLSGLTDLELDLGVIFTADLILEFDRGLDVTSGIHLKLDQGVSFVINLFGDTPSDISVNGGQFEFLPVTTGVNGAAFSAILRIGIHAGLTGGMDGVKAGLEAALFADVAKIVTNMTATPDDADCKLQMSQEYSFELGARIGASVAIGDIITVGPVAETFTPIWYTTMTGLCANEAETTAPSSPTLGRRDDIETTVTTKITQTGIACPQSLGPNCPLSLRSTTKYTETRSLITAVPSGEEATFPESTYATVSPEAFGSNVRSVLSSSGAPVSYVEPTSTSGGDSETSSDETGSGIRGATCNNALSFTSVLLVLVVTGAFAL